MLTLPLGACPTLAKLLNLGGIQTLRGVPIAPAEPNAREEFFAQANVGQAPRRSKSKPGNTS